MTSEGLSKEIVLAADLIHDALDAADASYHDRESGVVDAQATDVARALLAAGWKTPSLARKLT
jgi:hypothetical protein